MRQACTHSASIPYWTTCYMTFRHLHPSFLGRWLGSNTILLTTGSPRIFPRDLKKGWSSALKAVIRTFPSCQTRCHMIHSRLIYLQSAMYSDNHFAMYVCRLLLVERVVNRLSVEIFQLPFFHAHRRINDAEQPSRPPHSNGGPRTVAIYSKPCSTTSSALEAKRTR
jgi:hypothetical protein